MDLKFYLNKFLKVDNIEGYTMEFLNELKKAYNNFLDESKGTDPDFPLMTFGDKQGSSGNMRITINHQEPDDFVEDNIFK